MYAARADSGLEIPPTPFAVTHPELAAVVEESVRRFSQQSLNGDRAMDVVLSPPWGTAWLIDVDGLPEEEVEEQVAWELQQRLDAPLEEHIYAWHPQDDQVYAVVIRPEMLEFWDKIFQDSHLDLGSITLETGLVDPSIEAGADLLPLYHLWADRHGRKAPQAPGGPKAAFAFDDESPMDLDGDEILEEELKEFDADHERVRALDPGLEDEDEAEDALGAIFDKDGRAGRKRKKKHGFRNVVLILLLIAAAVVWQRNRIAQYVPGGDAIVQKGERIAHKGFRKFRSYAAHARTAIAQRTSKKAAKPVPAEQSPVPEQPIAQNEQTPEVTQMEAPPAEQVTGEMMPETGEEMQETAPPPAATTRQPAEQPSRRPSAPASKFPIVTVPLQTVELPPVKPSTGLALAKLFDLADAEGVEIETLILQGPGLRFEIGGDEQAVDTWAHDASRIPGGGASRVEPAALLAPGILVEMDLQGVEERSLTLQQFAELGKSLGIQEVEPSLWTANRAQLTALFKAFQQEQARPFRISIHHLRGDTYRLVVIP